MSARRRALAGIAIALLVAAAPARAQYNVLGSVGCVSGSCHAKENAWWGNDKHNNSINLLYDKEALSQKYASMLGISDFLSGKSTCMACHGTVVKPAADVEEGVSCESCHGPGSGYKVPHEKGYEQGVAAGLAKLREAPVRAQTCVRCHFITDQKLLATGHGSGANFDYAKGIRTVGKHWKRAVTADDVALGPFKAAQEKRGPVAKPTPPPAPAQAEMTAPGTAQDASGGTEAPARVAKDNAAVPAAGLQPGQPTPALPQGLPDAEPPPRVAAVQPGALLPPPAADDLAGDTAALDLPPRPQLTDSTSVRELLLAVQKRLELLYSRVRR